MSVNFESEISEEAATRLRENFGEPVEDDQKTFLFDKIKDFDRRAMGHLAALTPWARSSGPPTGTAESRTA